MFRDMIGRTIRQIPRPPIDMAPRRFPEPRTNRRKGPLWRNPARANPCAIRDHTSGKDSRGG